MSNTFTAFDLETTGLSPINDRIIEIGAVKIKNGEVISEFSELIYPEIKLSSKIIEITHITDNMLKDARSANEVVKDFVDFMGDDDIIGHNIMFDFSFIKTHQERRNIQFDKNGIDTLLLSRKFHRELSSKSLENMCSYYGIENGKAHRAFDDARSSFLLYQELFKEFYGENKKDFEPISMEYKVKKDQVATEKQKKYLIDLLKYHKIDFARKIESLTRSEASKMIDNIILEKGRIRL